MPELPEVENLRLGLERAILGQKIKNVEVRKPKLVFGKGTLRLPSSKKKNEFEIEISGEKFVAIERRAKNLIFRLSHDKIILAHLKMSGQFVYKPKGENYSVTGGHPIEISEKELPNKHTHIIFELDKGILYYNDTRMFGYVLYYANAKTFAKENHFAKYGLEPLDLAFTTEYLFDNLRTKKGKIKAVLMEQKIVTGLGNIYADESLFEAAIRPDRIPSSISLPEAKKLHKAILRIIKRAIELGGSSVATYRLLDETRGNYAREHKVYGKGNHPCINCKTTLIKTIIQGRTTIFCPHCQK